MKKKDPCWKGYEMVGTKKKGGKTVPNCVKNEQYAPLLPAQKKIQKSILSKEMQKTNPQTGGLITKDEIMSNVKGGKDYKTYHLMHNGEHFASVRAEKNTPEFNIKKMAIGQGNDRSRVLKATVILGESSESHKKEMKGKESKEKVKKAVDAALKESLFSWFKSGKKESPVTTKKKTSSAQKVDLYAGKKKGFTLPSVNDPHHIKSRSEVDANRALTMTSKKPKGKL